MIFPKGGLGIGCLLPTFQTEVKLFVPASSLVCILSVAAGDSVDFDRQIKPLLSNRCFACHGPDEESRKAGLDLSTQDGATRVLGGNRAIHPGRPDLSSLLSRITLPHGDPDAMPPQGKADRLGDEEVGLLKNWIRQGAEYSRHWSYRTPRKVPLPKVRERNRVRTPIDRFVLKKLEGEGLSFSSDADPFALIRRVSLDLTGLPPTWEEAHDFASAPTERNYQSLLDRIFAKPSFGERWARVWLDLARYADSAGYADDPPRTIWGYRDYVIRSFNENKPFDQFTLEQIAGDLFAEPKEEELVATAFHRNTQTNNEGGTIDEEFRNLAVVDRVNTTLAVWMGTTIDCAQCHTHKYDPITQEEYYKLFAIFNQTEDSDKGDERPVLTVFDDATKRRRENLSWQIHDLKEEIVRSEKVYRERSEAWGRSSDSPFLIRSLRILSTRENTVLPIEAVELFAQGGTALEPRKVRWGRDFEVKAENPSEVGDFPWMELSLRTGRLLEGIRVRFDENASPDSFPLWIVAYDEKDRPLWVHAHRRKLASEWESSLPRNRSAMSFLQKSNFTRYLDALGKFEPHSLHRKLTALNKDLAGGRGLPEDEKYQNVPTVPVMRELDPDKRRKTHLQIRGNYLDLGSEVRPGVPAAFHALPEGWEANRLGLAHWLVDEANPLTARVLANRYWEQLFGVGLVETSEEFGSQGSPPSHGKLLDWLAVDLMENGWDLKRLLRQMVSSTAYRQSSKIDSSLLERDPQNRLLARGPRFRISAEMVRDQTLFLSGLLSRKMYGPPVMPPQPEVARKTAFGGKLDWETSVGEDRYRRGLYTFWRRTSPYPSMSAFDAPNREVCSIRRNRTNTPMQALVTLNDPVFVEAAQALGRMTLKRDGSLRDRLRFLMRRCLIREPRTAEIDRLASLYEEVERDYRNRPAAARDLAEIPIGPAPSGFGHAELAAWTVVANVTLNLDEIFMKR